MAARREARIYFSFAVLSIATTAYLAHKLVLLVQRPFVPIDAVLIAAATIGLLTLTIFYAVLTFVFAARFVHRVTKDAGSLVLYRSNGTSIQVTGDLRVIRRFGKQFSADESQPAFVLFLAKGRIWVSPREEIKNGV